MSCLLFIILTVSMYDSLVKKKHENANSNATLHKSNHTGPIALLVDGRELTTQPALNRMGQTANRQKEEERKKKRNPEQ